MKGAFSFPPPTFPDQAADAPVRRRIDKASITSIQDNIARGAAYLLCFFDYGIRNLAPAAIGLILLASILTLSRRSVTIFLCCLPLLALGAIYVVLSTQQIFPRSWTLYFDSRAIYRQSLWIFVLPFIVSLGERYASSIVAQHPRREFYTVLSLLCANFVVSGFLIADWSYSIWNYGVFGYLWAPLCIFFLVAAWNVLMGRVDDTRIVFFLLIPPILFLAEGAQTKIAYLTMGIVLAFRPIASRVSLAMLVAMTGAIVAGYIWAWTDPIAAAEVDFNTAVRGLMVQTAWEAILDGHFLGIGYGTEGVRNVFPIIDFWSLHALDDDFLLVAPHNSFADVTMRMGVAGLAALTFALLKLAFPFGKTGLGGGFRALMFTMIVLNLSINVGLQSLFHMTGAAMMLGACVASRRLEQSGEIGLNCKPGSSHDSNDMPNLRKLHTRNEL